MNWSDVHFKTSSKGRLDGADAATRSELEPSGMDPRNLMLSACKKVTRIDILDEVNRQPKKADSRQEKRRGNISHACFGHDKPVTSSSQTIHH